MIQNLIPLIKNCTSCHLSSSNLNLKPLPGRGTGKKYLIVGVAPSYRRTKLSSHDFVMPFNKEEFTSYWLGKVLADLSVSEQDFYLTNLIKCSLPDNRQPEKIDWQTCISHFFFQELYITCPDKIICLGNVAYNILEEYQRQISRPLYKVFHHSYIARKPEQYEEWLRQWRIVTED